jgi:hypothetical protein
MTAEANEEVLPEGVSSGNPTGPKQAEGSPDEKPQDNNLVSSSQEEKED